MERIQTLIDKLYQQKNQNVSPSHLLFTVQMLHAELLQLEQTNTTMGTSKVAVSLPVNLNFVEEVVRTALLQAEDKEVVATPAKEVVATPEVKEPVQDIQEEKRVGYNLRKPEMVPTETSTAVRETPKPALQSQPILNPAFGYEAEAPTIVQYTTAPVTVSPKEPEKEVYELSTSKELHEMLGSTSESLNDRLKEQKTELAHVLTGSPVKDLKKAIGINDRFTFINELFRGDEDMYERSLKTINGFHVYSEAEYWINRELTFKLGWIESNPTVQDFYQLVRRRFA